ncbi:hypothetical protein BgiMline_006409, partial [Biomphalaria glabrata]
MRAQLDASVPELLLAVLYCKVKDARRNYLGNEPPVLSGLGAICAQRHVTGRPPLVEELADDLRL